MKFPKRAALARTAALALVMLVMTTTCALAVPPSEIHSDSTELLHISNLDLQGVAQRWLERVNGGSDVDWEDPDFDSYRDAADKQGKDLWKAMDKSSNPARLWPKEQSDFAVKDRISRDMTHQFQNLRALALAYRLPGGELSGETDVRDAVIRGMDFVRRAYEYDGKTTHKGRETNGNDNWYDYMISSPAAIEDTLLLLANELEPEYLRSWADAIMGYLSLTDVRDVTYTEDDQTGSNLTDVQLTRIGAALLGDRPDWMVKPAQVVGKTMETVPRGDGLYADGSMLFHDGLPYTAGYGESLLDGIARLTSLLSGTPWQLRAEDRQAAVSWIKEGILPLLQFGRLPAAVSGRAISRQIKGGYEAQAAADMMAHILEFAGSEDISATDREVLLSAVRANTKTGFDYIGRARDLKAISDYRALFAAGGTEQAWRGTKFYAGMERAIQATDRATAVAAFHSWRVLAYEYLNTENRKGWNTSDAALYVYTDDPNQFGEAWWPTADPTHIPGTTADRAEPEPGAGANVSGGNYFSGGVSDGEATVAGMAVNKSEQGTSDVKANKSYFFAPDGTIMALGSGISGHSRADGIDTTVAQRITDGTHALTVNGEAVEGERRFSLPAGSWIHLEGTTPGSGMGYFFPLGGEVTVAKTQKQGSYKDINPGAVDPELPDSYSSWYYDVTLNHGKTPKNERYAYVVLPGFTLAQTQEYAANSDLQVLRNDNEASAARYAGRVYANVWSNQGAAVAGITTSSEATFMLVEGSAPKLHLASPLTDHAQTLIVQGFAPNTQITAGGSTSAAPADGRYVLQHDGVWWSYLPVKDWPALVVWVAAVVGIAIATLVFRALTSKKSKKARAAKRAA